MMTLPQDRVIMPAPVPSHPSAQRPPASIASVRSQSVPTLLRPTGQYQYVVPPRISQTPPPTKNVVTQADIKAAMASIDHVLIAALGNPKDRLTLTKLETDVQKFLRNPQMTRLDFPPMSSYQRLMAHRIAEYYHMEHTAVDLDNSRRAVVLFKTAGSHCPDVQLSNIPEEEAALASGKYYPVNGGGSSSPAPGAGAVGIGGALFDLSGSPQHPEETPIIPTINNAKEEEVFEENSSYEPDPDMPPLISSEPPKQFKILRRRPSPSPEAQRDSMLPNAYSGSDTGSPAGSKANSEKTLEEREKDYALARARIFNYENLDGTAAAELAGLTIDEPSQSPPPKPKSESNSETPNDTRTRPDQSPERGSPVSNYNRSSFPGDSRRSPNVNGNPSNGNTNNGSLHRAHSASSTPYYQNNMRRGSGGPGTYGTGNPSPVPPQGFNSYGAPFHWGVSGGGRAVNQSHGMFGVEGGDPNHWFPLYPADNHAYYQPYFQPQSRQVPLFVPNGVSSPVIPPEHSFPQGSLPMYPVQQSSYSRGYGPNQKGRAPHPGYPPPAVGPSAGRGDKSFTPPRGDTSSPAKSPPSHHQQQQQQHLHYQQQPMQYQQHQGYQQAPRNYNNPPLQNKGRHQNQNQSQKQHYRQSTPPRVDPRPEPSSPSRDA